MIELESTPVGDYRARLFQEFPHVRPLGGHAAVGVHVTLGRLPFGDFGYGTPVRLLFDCLSRVLGGTAARGGHSMTSSFNLETAVGRGAACVISVTWQGTMTSNSGTIARSCNAARRRIGRAMHLVAASLGG